MNRKIITYFFVYGIINLFLSCNMPKNESKKQVLFQAQNFVFPYDLHNPKQSWHLSRKIREISGLSFVSPNKLACIQDENGYVFLLNNKNGKIEKKIKFAKDGDYEGVELVQNDIWVVKSNGDLYRIKNFSNKENREVILYKTPLSKQNDVEGLAYNNSDNSLLIACKGYPFLTHQKNAKSFKTIYKFDLNTNKLIEKPYILLALDSLKEFKHYSKSDEMGIEIVSTIDEAEGDPTLQPSAIAVHPKTQNIYLLSSVGKLLLVLSPQGKLLMMRKLNHKQHKQPEGICFAPDGTLYISNEGKKSKANILSYNLE